MSARTNRANVDTSARFTLSATVRNAGVSASPGTALRFLRSPDATITTADALVARATVGALDAGDAVGTTAGVTAPATAGTYHYGACVAPVAGETDTGNNCSPGVRVTVRTPPPTCDGGKVLVSNVCVCPAGQQDDEGTCRTPPAEAGTPGCTWRADFHRAFIPFLPRATDSRDVQLRLRNPGDAAIGINITFTDGEGTRFSQYPRIALRPRAIETIQMSDVQETIGDGVSWWSADVDATGDVFAMARVPMPDGVWVPLHAERLARECIAPPAPSSDGAG